MFDVALICSVAVAVAASVAPQDAAEPGVVAAKAGPVVVVSQPNRPKATVVLSPLWMLASPDADRPEPRRPRAIGEPQSPAEPPRRPARRKAVHPSSTGAPDAGAPDEPTTGPDERQKKVDAWMPPPPFTVHWNVGSWNPEVKRLVVDYQAMVDFGDAPVQRDVILLTESVAQYPKAGPHIIAMDPGYMRRHIADLRHDLPWFVPEGYTGICVLDWETWHPVWDLTQDLPPTGGPDAHDRDYKSDWRDYIRAYRPHLLAGLDEAGQERIFKETYEAECRRFFIDTITECKRLRPGARWTWYGFPPRSYWEFRDPAKAARWRSYNDNELAWMWDVVDVVCPSIYAFYKSCEAGCENTPEDDIAYIEANLEEALRVANGKPVFAYIWARYHQSNRKNGLTYLNEINMQNRFRIPYEMGVHGVIIWDEVYTQSQFSDFQAYFTNVMEPEIVELTGGLR